MDKWAYCELVIGAESFGQFSAQVMDYHAEQGTIARQLPENSTWQRELARLGQDGWELVTVFRHPGVNPPSGRFLFKKRIGAT